MGGGSVSSFPIKSLAAGFSASVSQTAHWPGPSLPSWPVGLQLAGVKQALALLLAQRQQGLADAAIGGGALN